MNYYDLSIFEQALIFKENDPDKNTSGLFDYINYNMFP